MALLFCSRTAPRPKEEASAEIFSALFGLYSVSTGVDDSSAFNRSKAVCCSIPQYQWFFLDSRSHSTLSFSARLGKKRPS
jgi:hypothetical protein